MPVARCIKQFALCMTGISGSGKTTLAFTLARQLKEQGICIEVIDGDETRELIGNIFGHSREDRLKMSRVNQAIGKYLLRNGINFVLSVVAPYEEIRTQFRSFFGSAYVQLYVKATVRTCEDRDVKGLYKMSREGRINHLNGSNDIFEPPMNNDLTIDTDKVGVDQACAQVIEFLCDRGYIA